ncbi:hypothetical protein Aab01nite_61530 [Paractinoplanes abujensis]|uniref:Uncharacterized protein n=1 Tax=Paractinoplanes abujensis TaxID=882441 RepID=A0A7W7G3N2_9ACTN|nr:hypothetical protein [Actinoplanes abujensis]MBB4692936.1 hypothetical protein [Actinoplanes abujensis]GID22563.1 hypothetical protein Aab01nite_61530 [Actinoplanes abujensis]
MLADLLLTRVVLPAGWALPLVLVRLGRQSPLAALDESATVAAGTKPVAEDASVVAPPGRSPWQKTRA